MKFTTAMRSPITSCASRTRLPVASTSGTSLSTTFVGARRGRRGGVVVLVVRQQSASRHKQSPSQDPLKDPRRA